MRPKRCKSERTLASPMGVRVMRCELKDQHAGPHQALGLLWERSKGSAKHWIRVLDYELTKLDRLLDNSRESTRVDSVGNLENPAHFGG